MLSVILLIGNAFLAGGCLANAQHTRKPVWLALSLLNLSAAALLTVGLLGRTGAA